MLAKIDQLRYKLFGKTPVTIFHQQFRVTEQDIAKYYGRITCSIFLVGICLVVTYRQATSLKQVYICLKKSNSFQLVKVDDVNNKHSVLSTIGKLSDHTSSWCASNIHELCAYN